jgi:hypothetical protein
MDEEKVHMLHLQLVFNRDHLSQSVIEALTELSET